MRGWRCIVVNVVVVAALVVSAVVWGGVQAPREPAADRIIASWRSENRGAELGRTKDAPSRGARTVHNVIAELRGAERPDELVIVGAHLDSWDFAQGAADNAYGVAELPGLLSRDKLVSAASGSPVLAPSCTPECE